MSEAETARLEETYVVRVDFRKAHDGLCALARDEFHDDPSPVVLA